jgi:hypothetical protein
MNGNNVLFVQQSAHMLIKKYIALDFKRQQKWHFNGGCLGRERFEYDLQPGLIEVMVPILI